MDLRNQHFGIEIEFPFRHSTEKPRSGSVFLTKQISSGFFMQ